MSFRRQIIYCHRARHNLIAGRGILTWVSHSSFTTNTIKWLFVVMTMVPLKCIQRGQTLNSLIIYCKIPEHMYWIRLWIAFFEIGIYFSIPFRHSLQNTSNSVFLKFIQLFLASCFDNQQATFHCVSKVGFPSWSTNCKINPVLWKHSTKLGTCSCSVVTNHT
jgi:hypothetical protein